MTYIYTVFCINLNILKEDFSVVSILFLVNNMVSGNYSVGEIDDQ